MLLTHLFLFGDVHQPLHVGAIYLPKQGNVVDPPDPPATHDPETETAGGNSIVLDHKGLHIMWWDDAPDAWDDATAAQVVANAPRLSLAPDDIGNFASATAGETVGVASRAFADLTYSPKDKPGPRGQWTATAADPSVYAARVDSIARQQIPIAGARLAALLNALWP